MASEIIACVHGISYYPDLVADVQNYDPWYNKPAGGLWLDDTGDWSEKLVNEEFMPHSLLVRSECHIRPDTKGIHITDRKTYDEVWELFPGEEVKLEDHAGLCFMERLLYPERYSGLQHQESMRTLDYEAMKRAGVGFVRVYASAIEDKALAWELHAWDVPSTVLLDARTSVDASMAAAYDRTSSKWLLISAWSSGMETEDARVAAKSCVQFMREYRKSLDGEEYEKSVLKLANRVSLRLTPTGGDEDMVPIPFWTFGVTGYRRRRSA